MSVSLSSPIFIKAEFTGRNGVGSVSVPGLAVGDAVVVMAPVGWLPSFESFVTVDDEMQQSGSSDTSAISFTVMLVRWL